MAEKLPSPNLDKVAKQRAALRRAIAEAGGDSTAVLKDIRSGRKPEEHSLAELPSFKRKVASRISGKLAEADASAKTFSISGEGGREKAQERIRSDKEMGERTVLDEDALRKEIGPVFDDYMQREHDSYELRDLEIAWLRSKTDAARGELQSVMREIRTQLSEQDDRIRKNNPLEARAIDLTTYVDELSREGHIAQTPYVNHCLRQIEERMQTGKPVFLHGPTGTGKTSLARRAAKTNSGHDAEMVYCNPQTRESNIWGKTGIRPVEGGGGAIETIDVLGPLARAMQEGKPVIFDEFNALPKEQMVFIKGVFNAKPGDMVNVVGNGRIMIKPGFQMMFTANLKSDKNPERHELPPEIAREFEQNNLEVFYNPPNEAFDIMLARLMRPDGSVQMSWHDLNTTLPKFCEALREIQVAYYDRESSDTAKLTGTADASGKTPSLKKFVMTQGTVEAILESWNAQRSRGNTVPFTRFLDQRLSVALTFKEYPESDRILAAKILASKGLLRTVTPRQLGLQQDVFNFDAAASQRVNEEQLKKLLEASGNEKRVGIMELANLDPFNVRKKPAAQAAQQFLTPEERKAPAAPRPVKRPQSPPPIPQSRNPNQAPVIPVPSPNQAPPQIPNTLGGFAEEDRIRDLVMSATTLGDLGRLQVEASTHGQLSGISKQSIQSILETKSFKLARDLYDKVTNLSDIERTFKSCASLNVGAQARQVLEGMGYNRFQVFFEEKILNATSPKELESVSDDISHTQLPASYADVVQRRLASRFNKLFNDRIINAKSIDELSNIAVAVDATNMPSTVKSEIFGSLYVDLERQARVLIGDTQSGSELKALATKINGLYAPDRVKVSLRQAVESQSENFTFFQRRR